MENNLINRYNTLASWVYHIDKPIGRSFGDIEYYAERLKNCTGKILEAGVGNGRVLIPLLEKGLNVVGFDASSQMLAYCQHELDLRGLKTTLKQQRFDNFNSEEEFEAIIIPAGSFQLITQVEEALNVLRRFKSYLKKEGRLIIDLSPISELFKETMHARQWVIENGLLTLTENSVAIDYSAQTSVSQLRYEHWQTNKGLIQTEIDLFALRFWGIKEFEMALQHVGFTQIKCTSNYNEDESPSNDSHTLTFEAS